MALSTKPWSSVSESDFKDAAAFCKVCLIDMNEGDGPKKKELCKLPVREPNGALNRNALLAAQGALVGARGGVQASPEQKVKAAKKLAGMMRANGMQPAPSMMRMMG